jgi:hypothetical protein
MTTKTTADDPIEQVIEQAIAQDIERSRESLPPSTIARICRVMAEIGDIPKNGWNKAQSYYFRRIEDVTVRVRDVMSENGLVCIPVESELIESIPYETDKGKRAHSILVRQTYAFVSVDDDSDRVHIQMIGEGADSLDKATTKALTGAFKYALLQSFAIGEAGDDPDGESGADGSSGSDETPPESFSATPEDIERAKAALALAHEEDLPIVRSWCILVELGSLSKGHVDRRQLPGFFALLDALAQSRLDFERASS